MTADIYTLGGQRPAAQPTPEDNEFFAAAVRVVFPPLPEPAPSLEKRMATLQAKCALVGVQLHATTDDHDRPLYVVVKWALTASMSTLEEVEQWLERFAGVKA